MKLVISIMILIISMLLFKKASGTLKLNLLNVVSYAFYSLLIFDFIGIIIIYCGFDNHYLIQKISQKSNAVNNAYWSMVWTMIILPITIIFFNKFIYKVNVKKENFDNIKKNIDFGEKKQNIKLYRCLVVTFIICLISTIYVFKHIGYIPFFKLFTSSFSFATERINSGRNFTGNVYIKNIIMLIITPIISYISYIYMRKTKKSKWVVLFILSFILSIFAKTYDFSKAPVIYYIGYFFFIEVLLGNTLKIRKLFSYIAIVLVLLIFMYSSTTGYEGKYTSLTNGPLSRIMITPPACLMLHFDTFPYKVDYLKGHSFPGFTNVIFGDGDYDVRSGRIVIQIYDRNGVINGTAGVMSAMFLGEAYANFGWIGIFIAPIIAGILISSAYCLYLKNKKTPLNIVLYLEFIIIFISVMQAGFIDFLYNINFLVAALYIFALKFYIKENNNTKKE